MSSEHIDYHQERQQPNQSHELDEPVAEDHLGRIATLFLHYGKKLGFIAQEMGREINTTGSKSNQAEMQNIVVRMKDELEQIKEQVLNAL